MTFNKLIMRYLVYLGLAGVLLSFPISFVVNIFLLDEGYKTCDKISWLSPTTYVKELSFCNNKKPLTNNEKGFLIQCIIRLLLIHAVFFQFLTQCATVNAHHLRSTCLVTTGVLHHHVQQWLFNFSQYQLI